MISNIEKQQIAEKLSDYCTRFGSQNKAANSLKGISAGTISQVINRNWDLISEEMWRNIASQIGYSNQEWVGVETRDFKIISGLLQDAQTNSMVFAVTGEAGTGKSYALKRYAELNKRAFVIHCVEFWNRRTFLQELLSSIGRDSSGYTVSEMMSEVVKTLKTMEKPILIMDEADKLTDQVLYFFISLYNQLEDHCGIILIATDHLAKRIRRGLKLNRKGYKEIYSRIGRKFIELKGLSSSDITSICSANGITDKHQIKEVIEDCEGDLRRIKRKVHAFRNALKLVA